MNPNHLEQIKTINTILNKKDFYSELCAFSNNDINRVFENISKIITYYLTTNDRTLYNSLSELFKKINNSSPAEIDFYIYPTNSFYYQSLKSSGIKPVFDIFKILSLNLEQNMEFLESELSFYPISENSELTFFTTIKEALEYGASSPQILFKGILKQPNNKEQPVIVGNSETSYYQSVFKERLGNLHTISSQSGTIIGEKCISSFIGQDILLTLLPKSTLDNTLPKSIKPRLLSFIKIPSRYTLLNICAKNKKIATGSKIDIKTGEPFTEQSPYEEPSFYITYSRYEKMAITDEFEYFNYNLTGDIDYDIDLIYGRLDSNNSREKISQRFQENLARIKRGNDISVRKIKDRYIISNGRHRLLYLKHFYVQNFKYYQDKNKLEELRQMLTIPINIEHVIEDPDINTLLQKIATLNQQCRFLKSDINNDLLDILIIIGNKAYNITSVEELSDLYNLLSKNNYVNKYFICYTNQGNIISYNELMDYLIITLQEKIFTMNIIDIIKYIKSNEIIINNQRISIEKLDLYSLYLSYTTFQNIIALNELYNLNKDLMKDAKDRLEMKRIGRIIMNVIEENPDYINYSWQELENALRSIPELQNLDSEYLNTCAYKAGYNTRKIKVQTKIHYK